MAVTWLQAAHLIPVALGDITFTYDPSGAATVSTWSPVGRWTSLEDLLGDWQAVLEDDLGAGFTLELVEDLDDHGAALRITTPGQAYSIAWGLHTGLRDALGEAGDVSARASAALWSIAPVTWYSRYGSPGIARSSTGAIRSHRVRLDGSSETGHTTDLDEPGDIDLAITLRWGPDPSGSVHYTGHYQLERVLSAALDPDRGGCGTLTLWHQPADQAEPDVWVFRLAGSLVVHPERQAGARPDYLWTVRLEGIAETLPW